MTIGKFARAMVVGKLAFDIYSGNALTYLDPMAQISTVTTAPHFQMLSLLAGATMCIGTGYHYKELGVWIPRSALVGKAKA